MITLVEKDGVVRNFQSRLRTRSGALLDVLVSARVLAYGGEPALVTLVRDVTEVNRNARRYQLLADNAQDVIWILDLETQRFSYVSPAIRRLRGLTVEEALAEPLEESMTPESLARVADMLSRPARSRGGAEAPTPGSSTSPAPTAPSSTWRSPRPTCATRPAGRSRSWASRATPRRASRPSGRWSGASASSGRSCRPPSTASSSLDATGRFTDVNEAFCTITGYSREELLGDAGEPARRGRDAGQIAARMARIQAFGSDRFETRYRRKDGRIIDVEVSVRFSAADEVRFHAFVRDVTERKRAEAELRESQQRLATIVRVAQTGFLVTRVDRPADRRRQRRLVRAGGVDPRRGAGADDGRARRVRRRLDAGQALRRAPRPGGRAARRGAAAAPLRGGVGLPHHRRAAPRSPARPAPSPPGTT